MQSGEVLVNEIPGPARLANGHEGVSRKCRLSSKLSGQVRSWHPRRYPETHTEEEEEALYQQQEAWLQSTPLVAARKAKGKHPNPSDDDPLIARVRRDLLLVEKAIPRSVPVLELLELERGGEWGVKVEGDTRTTSLCETTSIPQCWPVELLIPF